jgi:uncharacterized protein YeeX (DUF496 family)
MGKELDDLKKAIEAAAVLGESILKKSQMGFDFGAGSAPNPHHVAYTRVNAQGTASSIKAKGAPATPPDHGHMRFAHTDGSGNVDHLHVTKDRVSAGGGPGQRTPMSLGNYMFMHSGGTAANSKKLSDATREAYGKSEGDPQAVLHAIKSVTGDSRWTLHSHDKPTTPAPPTHDGMVAELHDAFQKHDRRGRGGMGISTDHPDYATPEKYLQTAKNILKFKGHERLGKKGANEVHEILKRHIDHMEHQGHDEQPVTIQAGKVDAGYRIRQRPSAEEAHRTLVSSSEQRRQAAAAMVKPTMTTDEIKAAIETQHVSTEDFIGDLKPGGRTTLRTADGKAHKVKIVASRAEASLQREDAHKEFAAALDKEGRTVQTPPPAVAALINQVETAAAGLMSNHAMEPHRAEVEQMVRELHQYPSAGHATAIVARLIDMGQEAQQDKADYERKVTDHVINQARVSNGDAQGIVEVHHMKHPGDIDEHHAKGTDPKEVAKQILAKNNPAPAGPKKAVETMTREELIKEHEAFGHETSRAWSMDTLRHNVNIYRAHGPNAAEKNDW